ncbi:MAG: endonuclease domain-containing protein [Bifidobacteriaceae bacterium]|jgi:very-short-patch-repair endonuclease|nr:endonuclease domain-containing protein [Bifidobacteriaceae bacterium]
MELTWPGAVVWGPSALQFWVPQAPVARMGVIVAASTRNRRSAHNLKLVRTSAVNTQAEDWRGVKVQSARWAIVDSLRMLDQRSADSLFAWLITRDQIPADFEASVETLKGQRGSKRLTTYIRYHASGAAAESEMLLHNELRRKGIRGWEPNATVRLPDGPVMNVDLLFKKAKLVIEIDGFSTHGGRGAFEKDRERDRRLTRAGYKVLRFTWRDLTERLEQVVAEVAFYVD